MKFKILAIAFACLLMLGCGMSQKLIVKEISTDELKGKYELVSFTKILVTGQELVSSNSIAYYAGAMEIDGCNIRRVIKMDGEIYNENFVIESFTDSSWIMVQDEAKTEVFVHFEQDMIRMFYYSFIIDGEMAFPIVNVDVWRKRK